MAQHMTPPDEPDFNTKTTSIGELLKQRMAHVAPQAKKPPHELAAIVDEINNAGLVTKKYGYTYWLGKVKRAGIGFGDIHGILKEIRGMDSKYSKGGRLTNVLTQLAAIEKKKHG